MISFVKCVENFISNIEVIPEEVVLERHETEEEAREYFGENFITKFDQLLTKLDKEETIVALHGTNEDLCQNICVDGLKYKIPCLTSTAILQKMSYGQKEIHYDNYEGLLNWPYKEYKGLIIIAIPYECFYKEGLWNKFQDTNLNMYGVQNQGIWATDEDNPEQNIAASMTVTFDQSLLGKTCEITYRMGGTGRFGTSSCQVINGTEIMNKPSGCNSLEPYTAKFKIVSPTLTLNARFDGYSSKWVPSAWVGIASMKVY